MSGTSYHILRLLSVLSATMGAFLLGGVAQAQNLALEGETGLYITPLAYTAGSPSNTLGIPVVGFHFIDGGSVLGTFSHISVNEGAFGRMEFGYTRDVHTTADNPFLSPLFHVGYNVVQAKVNIVRENTGTHNWIPAISAGFILRTQVHNVGGAIVNKDTTNGDVYIVGTKTITIPKLHRLPILLNGGFRGTNAELWGLAGNATRFEGRVFGAAGFSIRGPFKSGILLGSEVAQQPPHPQYLPYAIIPPTITYAMRVLPRPESKFNVDVGLAQLANHVMPGVDLKARMQFGMGVSYDLSRGR
jgi:Protein of unknown function (DUF3034)